MAIRERAVAEGSSELVRVASLEELRARGRLVVRAGPHTICLFADGDAVHAVDNRCPHMGFPLHRGTVADGILSCDWHHARFDLCTGGTFDPWADDLRRFPAEVRDDEVWVDLSPPPSPLDHQRRRLRDGLERNLSLVVGKAVIGLLDAGVDPAEPYRSGLDFGARNRADGWGQGLTTHTCFANLLPVVDPPDRRRALFHGLSAVAGDTAGMAPRFALQPLPGGDADAAQLKRWFRRFVEVRDSEGAERCLITAARTGLSPGALADILLSSATDHRYQRTGHLLDFTNKAFEGLDIAGWEHAEAVLPTLAPAYAGAERMEESNAWRHPADLVAILETAFAELPEAVAVPDGAWSGEPALVEVVLGDDPQAIADSLLEALRAGAGEDRLAAAVTYAAALRIARFPVSNEFGDWDTALHTFSFANAVQQGLRRAPSAEALRGVFDAAMSVYLDRFLNVPATRIPAGDFGDPEALLEELPGLLDRQQQVGEAGALVASYLAAPGDPDRLLAALGSALLREDRDFHTIQCVEAAFRQYADRRGTAPGAHMLIAAARYLAAHAPTARAQRQTFEIADRLLRGEHLYEDETEPAPD
jgi:nitrite reductase/ring-hydroxylating ferredoxin subunit